MDESQVSKDIFELFCDFLFGPFQRKIGLQILLILGCWILFSSVWSAIRSSVGSQNDYQITPERVLLESRPLWISPSLEEEVLLENDRFQEQGYLSLLDKNIGKELMRAFQAHPWVRDVYSVSLNYPASVHVNAVFREPIAFVETSSSVENGVRSLNTYQVDAEGVLLPTDFLAAAVATNPGFINNYIWIQGITSTPVGIYGQQWGDPVLDEAALLAEFLKDDFKHLGIRKIVVSYDSEKDELPLETRSKTRTYRLETIKGNEIIWGSFSMSDVVRTRADVRNVYESAKAEAFRKEIPKLDHLKKLAGADTLDLLPPADFPIDLSHFN